MKKHHLMRQCRAVGIFLIFISVSVFTSVLSEQNHVSKGIIKVDNEGDGDYTSIKAAVENASQGDTIEIYSGTYVEENITIETPALTLKGIPYELGNGGDSGNPQIIRRGWQTLFFLFSEGITITGLALEDEFNDHSWFPIIQVQNSLDCIISNNEISNAGVGIESRYSYGVQITNNTLDEFMVAIIIKGGENEVSGNLVSNANIGISVSVHQSSIIAKNRITRCNKSILVSYSENALVCNNHMEDNKLAIYVEFSNDTTIKQNNFVNNEEDARHFNVKMIVFQKLSTVRNNWVENYWDKWLGIGPKLIKGSLDLLLPIFYWGYTDIPMRFIEFDRHPARKAYSIT